jgi:hypothetical protein
MKPSDEIKLASNLKVPINIMTQRIAAVGGNGSGKSYFVMKMLEELLYHGAWTIILDPVGIHYGLRLDAAGKKPSGLNIPIFGGLHGDVILTPESGKLIADLLVDRHLSAVLDVSQFTDGELTRFSTDFGYQFFLRMKARKQAVLLVLEEAQEFIPQNPQDGEKKKLHIYSQIAKIGRNFGIGIMMVTPRPQDIAKKVFNLTQNMFAFQMTGLSERKTMKDWCDYVQMDYDLSKLLPTLDVGHPFVASPRFLKFMDVVHILPKKTFDSSSTPDFEDTIETVELSPIDISALQESMKGLIERQKENDPAELKNKIARLERELRARPAQVQTETKIERVEVPVLSDEQYDAIMKSLADLRAYAVDIKVVAATIESYPLHLGEQLELLRSATEKYSARPIQIGIDPARGRDRTVKAVVRESAPKLIGRSPIAMARDSLRTIDAVTGPMQKILDAIAWFESIGIDAPKQVAVAFLAGYTYGGGAFNNPRGALRSAGLVEYAGESIRFTDDGRAVANHPSAPLTVEEMQVHVLDILPGPHQKILRVLLEKYPNPITKDECAALAGYAPGGAFNNPLGRLRSMGLVNYPQPGYVAADPLLFLE